MVDTATQSPRNGKDEDLELAEMSQMLPSSSPQKSKSLPYPKGVGFIACTELGARFAYYGSRAVLTLYLRNVLEFSEDLVTTVYHSFLLLCYCLPMIWGIAADSGLGMYNTIWIVNLLFLLGNGLLTVGALPLLPIPLTLTGLLLMAVATGGMKPCLAPFGGEQFTLPGQALGLQQYFSIFFIATTIGNMAATVLTPLARKDVSCLGSETCYPLAFGGPTLVMLGAVGVFFAGKPFYKRKKSEGNILLKVFNCVKYAISMGWKSKDKKKHWLDHADGEYSPELISDIKSLLGLLIYYAPMPMFYALLEQLGSRWTLQASRMSGLVGTFHILPDQMQVSNAVFMLMFTPIFEYGVYPLARSCSLLRRPLQRMGLGLLLAGLSFLAAGFVEIRIQNDQGMTQSTSSLRFINGLSCPLNFTGQNEALSFILPSNETIMTETGLWDVKVAEGNCSHNGKLLENVNWTGEVEAGLVLVKLKTEGRTDRLSLENLPIKLELIFKSKEGNARMLYMFRGTTSEELSNGLNINLQSITDPTSSHKIEFSPRDTVTAANSRNQMDWQFSDVLEVPPDIYTINSTRHGENVDMSLDLRTGGVYLLLTDGSKGMSQNKVVVIVPPNGISILWLLPQYMLMSWGQILFIVSGMEFSYTQAPPSMKSVVQGIWSLMNAFGNVIVILSISAQSYYTHSQSTEYFQFAGLMGLNVIFFCILAIRYKYVEDR